MASKVRFLYTGLRVRDLQRSLRFYRGLGFRIVSRGTMKHGGVWVHLRFGTSAHEIELNYYPKSNRFYEPYGPGSEFDHFGFYSPDVAGWKRKALAAGATLAEEFDDGKASLVYVRDPNGVWLEVFGPRAAPKTVPKRRKQRN
ncbi:MAG: VOC family protein [Thermoplasmata archaeon]|nr:VOC family protein [Thermoplasmata archaeon]